jgi:hypothetical protein
MDTERVLNTVLMALSVIIDLIALVVLALK